MGSGAWISQSYYCWGRLLCRYLRPEETTHVTTAKFFEKELLRGTITENNPLFAVVI